MSSSDYGQLFCKTTYFNKRMYYRMIYEVQRFLNCFFTSFYFASVLLELVVQWGEPEQAPHYEKLGTVVTYTINYEKNPHLVGTVVKYTNNYKLSLLTHHIWLVRSFSHREYNELSLLMLHIWLVVVQSRRIMS